MNSSGGIAGATASELDAGVADLLDKGLLRLREPQRQAVLLRYVEGLSLEQAATAAGISPEAVAKREIEAHCHRRHVEELVELAADHRQARPRRPDRLLESHRAGNRAARKTQHSTAASTSPEDRGADTVSAPGGKTPARFYANDTGLTPPS